MPNNLKDAYPENHVEFEIRGIDYETDAREQTDPITFEYPAPAISVDGSGRFATHEIIGGSTVRQKIGEDPIEVSINGICKESTARQLDNLRDAASGTIYSNRLPGGSLDVQFASMSTSPMSDSGAVDLTDTDSEFLYTYTLECVEVLVGQKEFEEGTAGTPDEGGATSEPFET